MHLATARQTYVPLLPLKLADFDYEVPRERIARYPAEPRDSARMMVVDRTTGAIEHRTFRDLPDYFRAGDVVVVNDTKVFPARLYGQKERTGATVEVFLLRELNRETRLWDVLVDPARKVRVGNTIYFDNDLAAEVIDNTTSRGRTIRFIFDGAQHELYDLIDQIGHTPIPPYLRREEEPEDRARYQTIFAAKRGAVAAPTAGLHFTPELTTRLQARGVEMHPITLHTGLGSFNPVEVEDIGKHRMSAEFYAIPQETCEAVNRALESPANTVTVVGTTCTRACESSLSASRNLKAGCGWTDKFIHPPYDFVITQRLITNFHMPRSTLLIMVSSLLGVELMKHAYDQAIKEEYRLYSFGDGMLIV